MPNPIPPSVALLVTKPAPCSPFEARLEGREYLSAINLDAEFYCDDGFSIFSRQFGCATFSV